MGEDEDRHATVVITLPAPGQLEGAPPEITAPVARASRNTCPLGPGDIRSSSQLNSRPPPRPSSCPARSSGPAMKPSRDIDM
jgi:hypothetical protein